MNKVRIFLVLGLTVASVGAGRDSSGSSPPLNYYLCRINPLEGNFRVYKVENGKRTQLASEKLETETGQWYEVRAVMIGDAITCYIDGTKRLEARDDTFKEPGMVGLWTKADASLSFDDMAVYAPVPSEAP